MLLYLFESLTDLFSGFNVFTYITMRAILSSLTALLICFLLGPTVIRRLSVRQNGQTSRADGPETHVPKAGTPTMGGALILLAIVCSTLLWADLSSRYVWIVLASTIAFGLIGFVDDYRKLVMKHPEGLRPGLKFLAQSVVGAVIAVALFSVAEEPWETALLVPYFKDFLIPLGGLYVVFTYFVIVGTSNAVNLTDGLDGLAIVPVMIAAGCFALIAYLVGNTVFANYLQLHQVPGSGELAVFCSALVGASLGFLWFNAPPAMVFMGDTGSLSCGGALGGIAVVTKHELVLAIIGGLFVLETVSVIVQVASFRMTGRRVFRMAPLHHHFEQKGWAEPTIVIRFWIIASILALAGLSTLKLR